MRGMNESNQSSINNILYIYLTTSSTLISSAVFSFTNTVCEEEWRTQKRCHNRANHNRLQYVPICIINQSINQSTMTDIINRIIDISGVGDVIPAVADYCSICDLFIQWRTDWEQYVQLYCRHTSRILTANIAHVKVQYVSSSYTSSEFSAVQCSAVEGRQAGLQARCLKNPVRVTVRCSCLQQMPVV